MTTKKTITQQHCNACGYEWFPRVPNPKQCPRCKVYNYDKKKVKKTNKKEEIKQNGNV